jgi:hypothetical protein
VAHERHVLGHGLHDVQLGLHAAVWHGASPEGAGWAALVFLPSAGQRRALGISQGGSRAAHGLAGGADAVVVVGFFHATISFLILGVVMAMCEDCGKIEMHKRGANSHPGLSSVGAAQYVSMGIGQAKGSIAKHECIVCGTKWTYTNDKNDPHEGWSLGWS